MELAIIAAGRSNRLKSDGIIISKPHVGINNVPLIKRLIDCSIQNGVDRIHCIINEESEDLKKYLLAEKFPVKVNLIVKSTPSSLHSFLELAPFIKDNYFCLVMPDSVFSCNEFTKFILYAESQDNIDGIMAATNITDDEKPLFIEYNKDMYITRFSDFFIENCKVTGGLYYFSTRVYDEMRYALSVNMMHLRNYFRFLIEHGYKFKAYEFSKIIDVDHLSDNEVAEHFLEGNQKSIWS